MSATHDGSWLEISVICPLEASAAVAGLLQTVIPTGVSILPCDGGERICAYLPGCSESAAGIELVHAALAHVDPSLTDGRALTAEVATIREKDWAEAWKQYYHAMRVGRIVVKPTWEPWPPADGSDQARADDIIIDLDPGMAFGTGQHATTRMCLAGLDRLVQPGDSVADLGCGSGILSIAALKLGAHEALAVDIDALAVAIAQENIDANGVTGSVTVLQSPGLPRDTRRFDLIVANISAPVISSLAADIAGHLLPTGKCVLSGFTTMNVGSVRAALAAAGLAELSSAQEGEWLSIIAQRREAA
jgi:ribosomal protein L11 methyltransferase